MDPLLTRSLPPDNDLRTGIRYDKNNRGAVYTRETFADIRSQLRVYFGARVSDHFRFNHKKDANYIWSWIVWNLKKNLYPNTSEITSFLYSTGVRQRDLDPQFNYFREARFYHALVSMIDKIFWTQLNGIPIR